MNAEVEDSMSITDSTSVETINLTNEGAELPLLEYREIADDVNENYKMKYKQLTRNWNRLIDDEKKSQSTGSEYMSDDINDNDQSSVDTSEEAPNDRDGTEITNNEESRETRSYNLHNRNPIKYNTNRFGET